MSNTVKIVFWLKQELHNEIVKVWNKIKEPTSFDSFLVELIHLGLEKYKEGHQS